MEDFSSILSRFGGGDQMWQYIQDYAAQSSREIARTVLELFYVMKSPDTGTLDKTLIGAALAYQLLPEDLLPRDKFGLLGFLDNGVTLTFAYNRVKSLVTPQIENQVNAVLIQWFGDESDRPQELPHGQTPRGIDLTAPAMLPAPTSASQGSTSSWNDDEDVVID